MLFQDGIESVQVDLAFNVIGHVGSMMWAISVSMLVTFSRFLPLLS